MEIPEIASAVESLLFMNGEPMPRRALAKLIGVRENQLDEAIDLMRHRLSDPASGIVLIERESELELATSPRNAGTVAKLIRSDRETPLGNAALEVLAVIAYRAPISRARIEAVRGVNCSFSIRNLLLRGLIERRPNPSDGREYEYYPSFAFLESMGISKIVDLPEFDVLSRDERLAPLDLSATKNDGVRVQSETGN